MMIKLVLFALCAAVAIRCQVQPHAHLYEMVFDAVDADSNGEITKAEFDAMAPSIDIDGDGQVTKQEFIKAWESVTLGAHHPDENRHAAELLFGEIDGGTGSVHVSDLDKIFNIFDGPDGDGDVSKAEFLEEWLRIHPAHGTHHHSSPMP